MFRRRRHRFFRRKMQPMRVSWVSTLFNETALVGAGGSASLQVLLDEDDWRGSVASLRQVAHVKRIVYNGVMQLIPLFTTFAAEGWSLIWVIMVVTDNDLAAAVDINSTAAGAFLQTTRVLASGIEGGTILEVPQADVGTSFVPGHKISVDIAPRIKLQPEDNLVFAAQYQSAVTSTVTSSAISAFSRVLIEQP